MTLAMLAALLKAFPENFLDESYLGIAREKSRRLHITLARQRK